MTRHTILALVLSLCSSVGAWAQSSANDQSSAAETQTRGYWVDPSTTLMWAGKDNGDDVSWGSANKYCKSLRLAGYSDWRLPSIQEMREIYDKSVSSPGRAGYRKHLRDFSWHVKGNLFLTGTEWSSEGENRGYSRHFEFNSGHADQDPSGWPYPYQAMRALCVRSTSSSSSTH